jgi:IS5 family transposase
VELFSPHAGDRHGGTGGGRRLAGGSARATLGFTLGGDKNYDTHQFVQELRALQITPHVAQHTTNRASAIDGRTTRHPGYAISHRTRKRVEEIFGWLKTVGMLRKVKLRGVQRVGWRFTFAAAVYNLVRMRNLVEAAT